jgi:hypothetical protein
VGQDQLSEKIHRSMRKLSRGFVQMLHRAHDEGVPADENSIQFDFDYSIFRPFADKNMQRHFRIALAPVAVSALVEKSSKP